MNFKVYVRTALQAIYTKISSARVSWMRPSVCMYNFIVLDFAGFIYSVYCIWVHFSSYTNSHY